MSTWDGRAPAEGWWWVRDENGAVWLAIFRDGWWSVPDFGADNYEAASFSEAGYTIIDRCEPPGEAYARGWKAGIEAAAEAASWAHMVPPDGGSPTEGERLVAQAAADAIRSLTPPKDVP